MNQLNITFDDCSLEIINDMYSKSDIILIDNVTSEFIHKVTFNTIGSIEHVVELDDSFYVTNNCGYRRHDQLEYNSSVFNNVFELAQIKKDLSSYKKISKVYDDIYTVVGLFTNNNYIYVISVFCNEDRVVCELIQFSNKLQFIGKRIIFTIYKDKLKIPNITLRVIGKYFVDDIVMMNYLPSFKFIDNVTINVNL